jgi:glycerol-3-phosphate dehydrogenase
VRLRPSRGTHLVLGADTLPDLRVAVMAPIPGAASRFVFALPEPDGRVYVGITDEPADGPVPDVPEPSDAEVGFLLDVAGSALDRRLERSDVLGAFAGLRPLIESADGGPTDAAGSSADLSRRHAVLTSPDGVVTVVGGKLTTYRRMAEDAVDRIVSRAGLTAGPCRTRRLPLVGAGPGTATGRTIAAGETGLPRALGGRAARRLVRRFGAEAGEVLAGGRAMGLDEDQLLAPVADGLPVTRAELLWGVTHEGALDESDLLERRTRVGLVAAERALAEPAARWALDRARDRA